MANRPFDVDEAFYQESQEYYDSLPEYIHQPSGDPVGAKTKRSVNFTSKAGTPINKVAHWIGAEGFCPTTLDKECSKAARILHSFTGLGVPISSSSSSSSSSKDAPLHPLGISNKALVRIPRVVLQNCFGLAIFNVIRGGALHGSLAVGSGLVVARRPNGTWSPPSAFIASTIGAGFMIGLDIYECVCVLNTPEQLHAFTNPRFSLGGEASVALGPLGGGASVDSAIGTKTSRPMYSYMKSRGFWAGIQIDGTVIITRTDANAVFYDEKGISAKKILRRDVPWPRDAKPLYEVLRNIDGGDRVIDQTYLQDPCLIDAPEPDPFLGDAEEEAAARAEEQQGIIKTHRRENAEEYYGADAGAGAGAANASADADEYEVYTTYDDDPFADDKARYARL